MLDIYIYEKDTADCEKLKECCIGYLIRKNYEADIHILSDRSGTDEAALYILEFGEETENLSRRLRRLNSGSYIIVMLNKPSELKKAVTPGICPSGFLIRPVEAEDVDEVLDGIYEDHMRSSAESCGAFTIKQKSRVITVPYKNIILFESSNKKVIVRTENQEFEFYDTLDSIISAVPDSFFKIHKSFVVNTDRIASVNYGAMTVEFDDGSSAYISRTYKAALKEKMSGRAKAAGR